GRATFLGAVTEFMVVRVDTSSNPAPDCSTEYRTSTFTTTGGDQITLAGPGQSCGIDTPHGTALDSWTVTGGTGTLAGATGSGVNRVNINEETVPVRSVTIFRGTVTP